MRARKIETLARKRLLPSLAGFDVSRTVLYRQPVSPVLRGFAFEDSGFDGNVVYVWVFVLPLYVPSKHLTFTLGHRLENRKGLFQKSGRWVLDDPPDDAEINSMLKAMQTRGIPYLDRLDTPQDLVEHLTMATKLFGNVFVEQAIAFSLAKLGKLEAARSKLESLKRTVKPTDPWHHVASTACQLVAAIDRGTTEALLEEWTNESLHNLRLDAVKAAPSARYTE